MSTRDLPEDAGFEDEPESQPLDASAYAQPSDAELLAVQHRRTLPEVPGLSYRCPPMLAEAP